MARLPSSRKHTAEVPGLTPRMEGGGYFFPRSSGDQNEKKKKKLAHIALYICTSALSVSTIAPPMTATVSKPIPRLFSLILIFFASPTCSCG